MTVDKLLEAVFADPIRANIAWHDVEGLIRKLSGDVTHLGGSSVGFTLNGVRAVFHRPHPRKETPRTAIRRLRVFLENAGVRR